MCTKRKTAQYVFTFVMESASQHSLVENQVVGTEVNLSGRDEGGVTEMEFDGPRSERLEDCHIRNDDVGMNPAEALEAWIIHRDCDPVFCARRLESRRIIEVDADKYVERSNVHPLPTRYFRDVSHVACDP
ncbi:hypothetical protein GFY24_17925 [Nocardia sp. SYP-A9097]|uniref:hypothetical protein n=1 Tax=Nocardia sp. SYP-A9097 TaxID=2663237 RepID=UPI00129B031D|nr:hypothetical protein [Nocardia sp. SYP-A9097]MRH89304.1 hypothetical protein [Nocardia sp. SYP-A9097]